MEKKLLVSKNACILDISKFYFRYFKVLLQIFQSFTSDISKFVYI